MTLTAQYVYATLETWSTPLWGYGESQSLAGLAHSSLIFRAFAIPVQPVHKGQGTLS